MAHLSYDYFPASEGGIPLVTPVVWINLFFVPVLPLYLDYKSRRKPLAPGLEVLFRYCIAVSLNHVAAHALSFFLHKLTGVGFALDSARYTVIALLASVLLFAACAVIRCLRPELSISRIGEGKGEEHEQDEA